MVAESQAFSWAAPAPRESASVAQRALEPVAYRYSSGALAFIAAVFALLCVPFWRAIGWLWDTWTGRPEYSHGPALPLIAAFLVWQQRDRLETMEFSGAWQGPLVVAAAGALYLIGVMGAVYTVQQYALVIAAAGLLLSLTGVAALRRFVVPLCVLFLMVPQPDFILHNVSADLQLLSSWLGVGFVRAMGISVFLEGNVIDLGGYQLQVVEACDGLRYLFPLMTLAVLIAYFYKGAMWKRVTVFLLSIPITVLMNSLRVGTIGVLVERWGNGMAEGFLHEFQGWMVFMLSIALLIGAMVWLNGFGRTTTPWRQLFGLEFPRPTPAGVPRLVRSMPGSFLVAAGLTLALALVALLVPTRTEVTPAREAFAAFPTHVGVWSGRRNTLDPAILETLQLDDYIDSDFVSGGAVANLYVSYYASQRDRRVVHSPRACIPGAGWHIEKQTQLRLPGVGVRVNRMLIDNGDARQLVYYWFDQRGRNLTSELAVKWYLFWDALTRRRTDGAMVRLITPVASSEAEAAADGRLTSFAAPLVPELGLYIPH